MFIFAIEFAIEFLNKIIMEVDQKAKCTELLSLVIDGQATQEQRKDLDYHLQNCEECREEYLFSKKIKDSLKQKLQPLKSPSDLANSIQTEILNQEQLQNEQKR
jgi:predicted anti-sigma-YlaC factor YlaD